MSDMSSRDILRKIIKGDVDSLNKPHLTGVDWYETSEKEKWTYLHRALVSVSLTPKEEGIKFLLDKGVKVNSVDVYGNTALHYAARSKNFEAIILLIEYGAELDVKNCEGISPLHQTILSKPYSLECTESLLKAGASSNQIMGYVQTISHGEDSYLEKLFLEYKAKA